MRGKNALVVLFTERQEKLGFPGKFLGADAANILHFPSLEMEAAGHQVNIRKVEGLGINTHVVDLGFDSTFSGNRLVLGKGGGIMEYLANLDKMPSERETVD